MYKRQHVTNPAVKAIIDIGGQDVKGISIDTDGTVKNFAMNDKCAAGTGRFYEAMALSLIHITQDRTSSAAGPLMRAEQPAPGR